MDTEPPKNFESIIGDFTRDLTTVFPEYAHLWKDLNEGSKESLETLHTYCLGIYPERFFDIMYSNADIFAHDSKINVSFLPGVDFRILYNCDGVSENTRNSIWKYLQLLLFTLMGSMKDAKNFGNTANIFEAMDEDELHSKMNETMSGIADFFSKMEPNEGANAESNASEGTEECASEEPNHNSSKDFFANMPNPEELHEHMKGLLEGKLGKLAKEFTDEFTSELEGIFSDGDMQNAKSSKDILMQIIKNPQKMIVIFKRLAAKLQDKMKNGEISQEEMMAEMSGIMEKMKGMGGGKGDLAEMMKSMKDLPFMKMLEKTLGGKMDMNAMNRMTQQTATKERMLKKMEQRQQAKVQTQTQEPKVQALSDEELIKLFNSANISSGTSKKSKKGK
jgi:hypothetical protein